MDVSVVDKAADAPDSVVYLIVLRQHFESYAKPHLIRRFPESWLIDFSPALNCPARMFDKLRAAWPLANPRSYRRTQIYMVTT
jgi:hypothetical protein